MSTVQLRRDPFARATLVRDLYQLVHGECDWCGSRPGRFDYYWESDSIYRHQRRFPNRLFCSVSCWENYHS